MVFFINSSRFFEDPQKSWPHTHLKFWGLLRLKPHKPHSSNITLVLKKPQMFLKSWSSSSKNLSISVSLPMFTTLLQTSRHLIIFLQMTTILLQVCATQRELIHVMMMDISVKMDGMDIYVYMVSTIFKIKAVSIIVLFLRVVELGSRIRNKCGCCILRKIAMLIHIPSNRGWQMLSLVIFQNVDVMKRDQLMENVIQSLDNAFVKSINGVDKDATYQ